MNLTVNPVSSLSGNIQAPGSKSYSIRAFIIAACGGVSHIVNPSDCDDALVAQRVAKILGANIVRQGVNSWKVVAKASKVKSGAVNVKESGTALRFILPLLALEQKDMTITGSGTLVGRPNTHLIQTLRKMGVLINGRGKNESVPINIRGGKLSGGIAEIDGSLSSQFISALLIACPQIEKNTTLMLEGKKLVSADYIMMTRQVLKKTGVKILSKGPRQYHIKGNQVFRGLKNFIVPSDYGLAAFLLGSAALVSSDVTLQGHWDKELLQADGHIMRLLKLMGVQFKESKNSIKIKGPFQLKGGTFSLKDCPDLVPIISVLALFAEGKTRLVDIEHARVKESDRISDLREELLKVGADVAEKSNELIITPQESYNEYCTLDPHRDHRLAMAFCVLGLKLGVHVKDIECTSKSYPGFVRDFKGMGGCVSRSK